MTTIKYHQLQSYSEIGQSSKLLFSMGILDEEKDEIDEKFYRFKCRDFFNELVWKQWNGQDWPIYSFKTTNFPVIKDEKLVLLTYGCLGNDEENIISVLKKFDPSICSYTIDNVLVCELPKRYIRYTYMISYLTFLIRCVERFPDSILDQTTWTGNEKSYADSICVMTKKNLGDVYDAFQYFATNEHLLPNNHCGVDDVGDVGTNHNNTGIVAVLINPKNQFRQLCDTFWSKFNV